MKIVIGSAFRNSSMNAPRYFERVADLRNLLLNIEFGHTVRVIAVEGDSTDNTRDALLMASKYHKIPIDLRTCNHGGPVYGSTEQPERMVALSKVGNEIFEGVTDEDDILVYVESDLLWDPQTIASLVACAAERTRGFDVFSPKVMAGAAFYDIWGFRGLDGKRWSPFNPFHVEVQKLPVGETFVEMGSVGSCLVMRSEVARACRIRNDYCLVGWCENARNKGYRIAARLDLKVKQL